MFKSQNKNSALYNFKSQFTYQILSILFLASRFETETDDVK